MYKDIGFIGSFLERTILREMKGFDYYNIYLDNSYQNVITDKVNVADKEKEKLEKQAKLYCIYIPNRNLQDNNGLVHPGLVSTMFDTLGCYLALLVGDFVPPVTAYLNVRYYKAMEVGKEYISQVELNEIKGKKVFVNAQTLDRDGIIYNSMESMYIKTDLDNAIVKEFLKVWSGLRGQQITQIKNKKQESNKIYSSTETLFTI